MPEEKEITATRKRHGHGEKHQRQARIILAGNPNVGKSVIFGLLTGKYVTVSNYPGTTVEVSQGHTHTGNRKALIIDSPGVNSLIPMSEDEKVTRDMLLRERPDSVVLVADSKNLKRAMMLLIQIAEMGLPCILDLNMEDEARTRGIEIDYKKLQTLLGVEVIVTVAPERKGIQKLKESLEKSRVPLIRTHYGDMIEKSVEQLSMLLPEAGISKRSIALMILAGDESLADWLFNNLQAESIRDIEEIRDQAQSKTRESFSHTIGHIRIKQAEEIATSVQSITPPATGILAKSLNQITLHPVLGIPVLLVTILGFYGFVGKLGAGILVDFFENIIFARYLNPVIEKTVTLLIPVSFVRDMFVGQYGIFTMALTYAIGIILPITTTFFIAFGILEDSGYLPRIAVLSNRVFRLIGLNGKAVLPMVLGLGCGTMATMTTRILETKRERIIATFLIALTIPCSAQLGVIFGMLSTLSVRVALWWAGCLVFVLIFSGYLASRIVPGEKPDFFMEIPPLRLPKMGNIFLKTLSRVEWYLKEAVPLFLAGTFILFLLDKIRILDRIEHTASPLVVTFLGLPAKATEAFLMGFLRRDYGAAGMFTLQRQGLLNENQVIVSIVTLTLFVPCLASFFMMVKERGIKTAGTMMAIITPFALSIGGLLNFILNRLF
jgi:ferrous iron transport protein B